MTKRLAQAIADKVTRSGYRTIIRRECSGYVVAVIQYGNLVTEIWDESDFDSFAS